MSSLRERVNAELEALRAEYGGTLKQEQVVSYAQRAKDSALHEDFDKQGLWNDKAAAHQARLAYAARIMRLYLIPPKAEGMAPVRALVSLIDDRRKESGLPGYRHIEDVMSDDAHRANLLATARSELRAFKRKYQMLTELAEVWDAVDRVEARAAIETENTQAVAGM